MHIVISGDSWANGAYNLLGYDNPSHPGIEYFLAEQGHRVTNLAVPGGSNGLAIEILKKFIEVYGKPDLHIFWPCAFSRDSRDYKTAKSNREPDINRLKLLRYNWNGSTVQEIILPQVEYTCKQFQTLKLNTISFGGNSKFHPAIKKFFSCIPISACELVLKNFEDSYFSDRKDLELFAKLLFKSSNLTRTEKYSLINFEMKLFMKKYDDWHDPKNSKYINMQHGTIKLHKVWFNKIQELIQDVK